MPARSRPPETPTTMGVPTAPKETGVDWIIMPTTTAASAGKPSATISGAATAAGVPKPEAPSMKQPNSQATMIACTRRSGLMPEKPLRIALMPPECLRVLSSRMAPKMIHRIETVRIRPWKVEASTRVALISQANRAIRAVTTNTIGMAVLAAMRRPISSTPASTRGTKASSARRVSFMERVSSISSQQGARAAKRRPGVLDSGTLRPGPRAFHRWEIGMTKRLKPALVLLRHLTACHAWGKALFPARRRRSHDDGY